MSLEIGILRMSALIEIEYTYCEVSLRVLRLTVSG